LVSQVMTGVNEPQLIIPAEASPHEYSLRPSQAESLANSRVVFWMGAPLTPWFEKAIDNVAGSAQKLSMLELESTITHEYREGATFEEHAHHDEHDDHKEGDAHQEESEHAHEEHPHEDHDQHEHEPGLIDRFLSLFSSDHHDHDDHHEEHHEEHHHDHDGVDPHAWLDPVNAKLWVAEISRVLSKHDPENAQTYASNAEKATAKLDALIQQTSNKIADLGELKFIVFHDAYQYFEKRFGITATGSISLGDAEDPSPARVEEIRDTVKQLGVNCAFTEPQYNAGLVANVFEGSSVTAIGVMDPLGASIPAGSGHYETLIGNMVRSLSQCKQ